MPDKIKVEAAARRIFTLLLEEDLTEAETVAALAMGSTMRLAYDSKTFDELNQKVQKLGDIFKSYAAANIAAFEASMRAKEEVNNA